MSIIVIFIIERDNNIEFYEHYDLHTITTPVKVSQLEQLLRQSNYPEKETKYLVEGFTCGFDFHYEGSNDRRDTSRNLPLTCGTQADVWQKMMKEVKLHRFAGPFKKISYDKYIQSPIGLVPKSGGQTRLIFHLSYNFKDSGNKSVNECMPDYLCLVKYKDLDHATANSLKLLEMVGAL